VTERIGVIGLSHLGVMASACLSSMGFEVTAVGDSAWARDLAAGTLPVQEPGLEALLSRRRPTFTGDFAALKGAEIIVVALDTVTDADNRGDLSELERHLDLALPWLPADGVVALMSQVPVGFTRAFAGRLRAKRPDLRSRIYYWVETLVIGDAVARYLEPERIILGGSDWGGPEAEHAPEPILDALVARFGCPVFRMSYESAELGKAAINLYLATSVTYANALADLCEATGASVAALLPALRSDRRIGPHAYIRPGLGLAGGNLERDLVYLRELATGHGIDARLPALILERSAARYDWLRRAVERHVLRAGARPRVALWGLAYKKNSRSTKNAVSLRLLGDLAGRAVVCAYDPQVTLPPTADLVMAPSAPQALEGADALVILTDWDEFATVDPSAIKDRLRSPVVVDAAGVLDGARCRRAGLTRVAIGEAP
jgi:UDPglucose 6-dehydrogenase